MDSVFALSILQPFLSETENELSSGGEPGDFLKVGKES